MATKIFHFSFLEYKLFKQLFLGTVEMATGVLHFGGMFE